MSDKREVESSGVDLRLAEEGEDRGDLGMVERNVEVEGVDGDLKCHGKRTQSGGHEE